MTKRDQVIDLIEDLHDAIESGEVNLGVDYGFTVSYVVSALEDVLLELEGKHPFEK
jgi:hypothetical protein